MRRFAAALTSRQFAFARQLEAAGITTLSQAVRCLERGDVQTLAMWRDQLAATTPEPPTSDERHRGRTHGRMP